MEMVSNTFFLPCLLPCRGFIQTDGIHVVYVGQGRLQYLVYARRLDENRYPPPQKKAIKIEREPMNARAKFYQSLFAALTIGILFLGTGAMPAQSAGPLCYVKHNATGANSGAS
jgi:hypothetical protein